MGDKSPVPLGRFSSVGFSELELFSSLCVHMHTYMCAYIYVRVLLYLFNTTTPNPQQTTTSGV